MQLWYMQPHQGQVGCIYYLQCNMKQFIINVEHRKKSMSLKVLRNIKHSNNKQYLY